MRLRLSVLAAGAVVVAVGLTVRATTDGPLAKYAGVALYASFLYAVVVAVQPLLRPLLAGAVSLVACWAVELLQLTPLPASLSARSRLAELALGSTFSVPDLFWYAVGAAAASLSHRALLEAGRAGSPSSRHVVAVVPVPCAAARPRSAID